MKAERLQTNLEKQIDKIKNLNYNFVNSGSQDEFDEIKTEVVSMLEEMIDLVHNDNEEFSESEEEEDDRFRNL
jgi:hypothetical protein